MPPTNVDTIVLSSSTITIKKGQFFYLSFYALYKGKQVSLYNYKINIGDKSIINAQYYGQTIAIMGLKTGSTTVSLQVGPVLSDRATVNVISSTPVKRFFSRLYFSTKYFSSKYFG